MTKGIFYHAGCPVCISAEQDILKITDRSQYNIEIVHIGEQRQRISEAEKAGVKSVPALILDGGHVLHINYGASLEDVKKSK
jgi:glutaredoxin 3